LADQLKTEQTTMLQALGRLHLLVLHLPIGILLLSLLLALASRHSPSLRPAVGFALFWGMLAAVAAAAFGQMLSLDGSYDAALLNLHRWLGFGTAALAAALYFLHKKRGDSPLALPLHLLTVAVLTAAGHFGGSLTHGTGYLLGGEAEPAAAPALANLDSAEVFAEVVLPVLKARCGNCHNPAKRKGSLVVLTKEDLLKGGENGPAVQPDQPAESLLLKAIHLPPEAEAHMPPKGKPQLSGTEKQLLDWWLRSGAPFGKTVAAAAMPDALRAALQASAQPAASPLDALQLKPASEAALQKLRNEGLPTHPLAAGSPYLAVHLADRKDLTPALLGKLRPVAKNVVQLHLARSNADDALLAAAAKALPHLNHLQLQQTAVGDAGLAHLAGLQYLEYLNLYGTKTSDAGLAHLAKLPRLRSLYLWQTATSPAGAAKFASQKPGILLDQGAELDSMFAGTLALKPPTIQASNELFRDTVQVALSIGFAKAKIHFTTDGTKPDSTSPVYAAPLTLSASSEVKAIAHLAGWTTSPVAARQFVKVRYQPEAVALALPPDPKYKGDGDKTLIDLQRGGDSFKSGKWLGWQGKHCTATLDLGQVTDVSRVTVGAFEDTGGWLFFPKGLRVSTSVDGKAFKLAKLAYYPVATAGTKPSAKTFSETFGKVQARYVRVEVLNVLKNPAWHPNKGEPCWVFVDEVLVE
jgi:hypothetical protein